MVNEGMRLGRLRDDVRLLLVEDVLLEVLVVLDQLVRFSSMTAGLSRLLCLV